MEFAMYKCKLCGKVFGVGLRENELEDAEMGTGKHVKKKIKHICSQDRIGIAKLVGFSKQD